MTTIGAIMLKTGELPRWKPNAIIGKKGGQTMGMSDYDVQKMLVQIEKQQQLIRDLQQKLGMLVQIQKKQQEINKTHDEFMMGYHNRLKKIEFLLNDLDKKWS